jgi:hypothetical protein
MKEITPNERALFLTTKAVDRKIRFKVQLVATERALFPGKLDRQKWAAHGPAFALTIPVAFICKF